MIRCLLLVVRQIPSGKVKSKRRSLVLGIHRKATVLPTGMIVSSGTYTESYYLPGRVVKQSEKKRMKLTKSSTPALSMKLSLSMATPDQASSIHMNSQSSSSAINVNCKTQPRVSFGFLDGISEPAVKGFTEPGPGNPAAVDPGIIVTGYEGDPVLGKRESWSFDGSFLVFRWLFQLVPEFNKFLKNNALSKDGEGRDLTTEEGSDLLGARMVGRWKSGAPIVQTPWKDDSKSAR